MPKFTKFPSIESFAHVIKGQTFYDTPAKVRYGAKIKLHGTNAAVSCGRDGIVTAQSRSRIITPSDDNCGFAAWVAANVGAWSDAFDCGPAGQVTVYGEWAGKGIQKGDAVTQLNDKYFFPFMVQVEDQIVVAPDIIEEMVPDLDQIVVLPWDKVWMDELDLGDADACRKFSEELTAGVEKIGELDPLINGVFDIQGPGEGWVICPLTEPGYDPAVDVEFHRDWYSSLTFKVKTEGHAVKKNQGAKTEIVIPEGVLEFVDTFVTDARMEQGLSEIGGEADPKRTGEFLKWVGQDVKKESVEELEAAGLEWKDVSKHVTTTARGWWLAKCNEI